MRERERESLNRVTTRAQGDEDDNNHYIIQQQEMKGAAPPGPATMTLSALLDQTTTTRNASTQPTTATMHDPQQPLEIESRTTRPSVNATKTLTHPPHQSYPTYDACDCHHLRAGQPLLLKRRPTETTPPDQTTTTRNASGQLTMTTMHNPQQPLEIESRTTRPSVDATKTLTHPPHQSYPAYDACDCHHLRAGPPLLLKAYRASAAHAPPSRTPHARPC
jgi:hypothetical protein